MCLQLQNSTHLYESAVFLLITNEFVEFYCNIYTPMYFLFYYLNKQIKKKMIRTRNGVEDTRTKRTTSSAACMDPERIRKAKDILSWTLMLKLDPAGKPYRRLDVVLALASTALFKDNFDCLECLWPPSRNAEWYVTLSNEESKLKLINEEIKVNGKYGHFLPAGSSEYRARIHWLPRWIDNGTLWRALQAYKGVEVKQITSDKSTININPNINFRHSFIGPRSVIIPTDKIDNIPRIIKIKDPILAKNERRSSQFHTDPRYAFAANRQDS